MIQTLGPERAGSQALSAVAEAPGGFWLHVSLNVLKRPVFSATDNPLPGGLDWEALSFLLEPLVRSRALRGVSIAGYDPEKDLGGQCAEDIVRNCREIFAS
jgi:arginase